MRKQSWELFCYILIIPIRLISISTVGTFFWGSLKSTPSHIFILVILPLIQAQLKTAWVRLPCDAGYRTNLINLQIKLICRLTKDREIKHCNIIHLLWVWWFSWFDNESMNIKRSIVLYSIRYRNLEYKIKLYPETFHKR